MNKSDYQNKMQQMINDGIRDGIYKVTADILYCNFYGKFKHYEKMLHKIKPTWSTL